MGDRLSLNETPPPPAKGNIRTQDGATDYKKVPNTALWSLITHTVRLQIVLRKNYLLFQLALVNDDLLKVSQNHPANCKPNYNSKFKALFTQWPNLPKISENKICSLIC